MVVVDNLDIASFIFVVDLLEGMYSSGINVGHRCGCISIQENNKQYP